MKALIGVLMIFILFASLFVYIWMNDSFLVALKIYASVSVLIVFISIALNLIAG